MKRRTSFDNAKPFEYHYSLDCRGTTFDSWCIGEEQLYLRDLHVLERTTVQGKTTFSILQFHSQIFYSCSPLYRGFSHDFRRYNTVFSKAFFFFFFFFFEVWKIGGKPLSNGRKHKCRILWGSILSCCEAVVTNYSRFCWPRGQSAEPILKRRIK